MCILLFCGLWAASDTRFFSVSHQKDEINMCVRPPTFPTHHSHFQHFKPFCIVLHSVISESISEFETKQAKNSNNKKRKPKACTVWVRARTDSKNRQKKLSSRPANESSVKRMSFRAEITFVFAIFISLTLFLRQLSVICLSELFQYFSLVIFFFL